MKMSIKLLLSACILISNAAGSIAQQSPQQKQFPKIPERPGKHPAARQIIDFKSFQTTHPGWKLRWDTKTGVPASIYGIPIQAGQGSPEEIARRFLNQNRTMFKMNERLTDLMLFTIQDMTNATHVIFR